MSEKPNSQFRIVTAADHPGILSLSEEIVLLSWPEFMLHDLIANKYWDRLYSDFPEYQFCYFEPETGMMMASGNCMPLCWDGKPDDLPDEGWDWALKKGFNDLTAGDTPNVLCALSITVHPAYREQGISRQMIQTMKSIGRANNLKALIAPVRPFLKSRYPLIPIENYIGWKDDDGLPFDSWMRAHAREGGRIIKICSRAMLIEGTIAEWEKWSGMEFPESGLYTVHGALTPIEMDRESDLGRYIEPNVWMYHLID